MTAAVPKSELIAEAAYDILRGAAGGDSGGGALGGGEELPSPARFFGELKRLARAGGKRTP